MAKSTAKLDRALADQPAEVRARVYEIVLRYGIDPDDEFFLLFVAFGYLTTLVEDAPEQWTTVFKQFNEELDQWAQTNLAMLGTVEERDKTTQVVAKALRVLAQQLKEYGKLIDSLEKAQKPLLAMKAEKNDTLLSCLSKFNERQRAQQKTMDKLARWIVASLILNGSVLVTLILWRGGG